MMLTTRTQGAMFALASVVVTAGWLLVSVIGPAYLDPSATQAAMATHASAA